MVVLASCGAKSKLSNCIFLLVRARCSCLGSESRYGHKRQCPGWATRVHNLARIRGRSVRGRGRWDPGTADKTLLGGSAWFCGVRSGLFAPAAAPRHEFTRYTTRTHYPRHHPIHHPIHHPLHHTRLPTAPRNNPHAHQSLVQCVCTVLISPRHPAHGPSTASGWSTSATSAEHGS